RCAESITGRLTVPAMSVHGGSRPASTLSRLLTSYGQKVAGASAPLSPTSLRPWLGCPGDAACKASNDEGPEQKAKVRTLWMRRMKWLARMVATPQQA